MARKKKPVEFFGLLKILAGIILFFLVIFSVSVVKVIPFFEIKHVLVIADANVRKLSLIAKDIIDRELSNNYLMVLINRDYLLHRLRKATEYYVKGLNIENYNWHKGVLVLKVYTNRAVALLNERYNLAPNGLIFGFIKAKNAVKIYDIQQEWHAGNFYTHLSAEAVSHLQKTLRLNEIWVSNDLVKLKGEKVKVVTKRELINQNSAVINHYYRQISQIYTEESKYLNLLGSKAIYVKIFRE
jgi:hypothetical protein